MCGNLKENFGNVLDVRNVQKIRRKILSKTCKIFRKIKKFLTAEGIGRELFFEEERKVNVSRIFENFERRFGKA